MPAVLSAESEARNRRPGAEDAAAELAVRRKLRAARARLLAQRFFECFAAALLVAAGALVALAAASVFSGWATIPLPGWRETTLVGAAALLAALLWTRARRWDLPAAARELDRRAATRDRFATALTLAARGGEFPPVERLAWEECARFARDFPVPRWTPFSLPRAARWLPVPLVTLAFLLARPGLPGFGPANPDPAVRETIAAQTEELKRAAETARRADDPAAQTLAAELERAARRLQEAAGPRDALRELSALEARLKQITAARPSAAELAALAAALQRTDPAAAEALRRGDLDAAARQLEKLLEQLKAQGDNAAAETLAQLARSLKEQAEKLSAEQRGEVARQMQQAAAAAAEAQKNAELVRKISELLRQAAAAPGGNRGGGGGSGQNSGDPGEGGASGGGRRLTTQQLQSLLNALENMKSGLNGNPGDPARGGNGLRLAIEDFANAGRKPGGESGNAAGGSGQTGGAPGSEHDVGTTDKIFDDRPAGGTDEKIAADRAARAQGAALGEGESLQDFAPSALPGAPARAGRRYRELYEAMEPAAQEAVRQENIPLGSRFLVERYFKNIRPPE